MEKWFIVINGERNTAKDSWSNFVWNDIRKIADVKLETNNLKNDLMKKLLKLHFANKLNNRIRLPFKGIWNKYFSVQPEELCDGNNYIIFQTGVKFAPSYIKKLKTKYNTKIILYMPDTIQNTGIANTREEFEEYKKYYNVDLCFSFDKADCEKFGMEFVDFYSVLEGKTCINKPIDLLYIGKNRSDSRFNMLLNIWETATAKDIRCDFHITNVKRNNMKHENLIVYNQQLPYFTVVDYVKASKCILEIMNEGQEGNTLRFKEAICYNKKLITNNATVKQSPYYNPDYIQVFSNVEDIDWDWIYRDIKVDYGYRGEFSPKKLVERILRE